MVKQPKANGKAAVVLERQYGPYTVKVCFAEQGSGAVQKLLDMIMQAYRCRIEKAQNLRPGH